MYGNYPDSFDSASLDKLNIKDLNAKIYADSSFVFKIEKL